MSAAEMPAGAAPERAPDWHSIEWKKVWRTVRRLQARIVKAVAEGRWNKVKALVYPVVSLKNSTINEQKNTISKPLNLLDAGHLPSGSYRGV